MKKIVQFLPYFPPHKGGLETVAEEWGKYFVKYGYGEVLNLTFSVWQDPTVFEYTRNWYRTVVIPAFDLIHGFPFPKFWSPKFWKALSVAREFKPDIVQTHTRFFLSSVLWGLFAKWFWVKWVHVEHGSWFVVSDRFIVKWVSRLFDYSLGSWVIRSSNAVVAISQACADFVLREYKRWEVKVIYRWMEFEKVPRPARPDKTVRIVFVWRLVALKGVHILLEAVKRLIAAPHSFQEFHLSIVGDGEKRWELEAFVSTHWLERYVSFLGEQSHESIIKEILPTSDILINPSFQEGLPTTVVEGLVAGCFVIATDVWGTREIHGGDALYLVEPGDVDGLVKGILMKFDWIEEGGWANQDQAILTQFDSRECSIAYHNLYSQVTQ